MGAITRTSLYESLTMSGTGFKAAPWPMRVRIKVAMHVRRTALLGERRVCSVSGVCVRVCKNVCVSVRCSGRLVMLRVRSVSRGVSRCVFGTSGVATLKQLLVSEVCMR
jgi:hypothetical protein